MPRLRHALALYPKYATEQRAAQWLHAVTENSIFVAYKRAQFHLVVVQHCVQKHQEQIYLDADLASDCQQTNQRYFAAHFEE